MLLKNKLLVFYKLPIPSVLFYLNEYDPLLGLPIY